MKFIGITGGVGAGKSTVLDLLKQECNCKIVLCDDVAAELMTVGHDVFEDIKKLNWPFKVFENDEIIRPEMARALYTDKELLEELNAIVHPAVKKYVLAKRDELEKQGKCDYFFIEAALLIEDGYDKLVDELWYISVPGDIRRKRLKESRGYSDERIDNMLKNQLLDEDFIKASDRVIDNSRDVDYTRSQIRRILDSIDTTN